MATLGRFPWKTALAAGGVAFSALSLINIARRNAPSSPRRVALIGDSYAVGLGPELEKTIPEFRYEGHVNTGTRQWAHHSECGNCGDWLSAFKPELVLVSLGVNDGNAPDLENYQAIVQTLHGIGARVVWVHPPHAVPSPSHGVISSLGVLTVPPTTTPISADQLHPNSYAQWAREIAEVIRGA